MTNENININGTGASNPGEEWPTSMYTCPLTREGCTDQCQLARMECDEPFCGLARDMQRIADALEQVATLML